MSDEDCVAFLQWALPQLRLHWPGFRRVRRQVCKRLRRRLEELSLTTLDQYRDHLMRDEAEWAVLDGFCHITISTFYRDKHVFDVLAARILPEIAQLARQEGRSARCWCAGCASGEEVYTIRILWDLQVQPEVPGSQMELVGTDADEIVLRRAQQGCFSPGSLKEAPPHWRGLAFTPHDHAYCVRDDHRQGITFLLQDIRSELPEGPFDLILCRNLVFTYFEPDLQRLMLDQMAGLLREGGYLVIGAHEQLPPAHHMFEEAAGCREVFRKRERRAKFSDSEPHC
jgi:chemotaxis protein methyltransferase CheR